MSIHTRLLLLVLAVWLPSMAGFGLLSHVIYLREAAEAHGQVHEVAHSLHAAVERELDTRATLAKALASSVSLRDGDVARFYQDAVRATEGSANWAVLMDDQYALANTLIPFERSPTLRSLDAPVLSNAEPSAFFIAKPRLMKDPLLLMSTPVRGGHDPRWNVAVGFRPEVLQSIIAAQEGPPGTNVTIVDRNNVIVARSRDPEKWIGKPATERLRSLISSGATGFMSLITVDGVTSLGYVQPIGSYGWTLVVALPEAYLSAAATRLTIEACIASALLLILGLGVAAFAASRISRPIRALRAAADELERDSVPAELESGLAEADEVGAALHRAGVRSRDATVLLERRVTEAVETARLAQQKSFESQKHEAIGRLTGGFAHDFNNLLQTVNMGLQMMAKSSIDPRQRRMVDAGLQACSKGAELVRHMLAFGRTQPLRAEPTSVQDFALRIRDLAGKAVGEQITLAIEIDGDLPPVLVDPTQMELALLNLIFNARDAMSDGGLIRVLGRRAELDEVPAGATEEFACLDVIDEGDGMDQATLARVLEPYFTTKPVGLGSGLGLAQVHAFARQSAGDLILDSTPGLGTRITIVLPMCAPSPEGKLQLAAVAPTYRALDILMVEDDPLVSSVVVPALGTAGHRVTLCVTADEGLRMLVQGGEFDAVFTDVVTPGHASGFDLARWCQDNRPGLGVVAATGYSTQPAPSDLTVLRKPYALEDALDALDAASSALLVT